MTRPAISPAARLDLDAMRALVAIAEASTVTLAAARLGRTPAAISMQLKKLEETLGAQLFHRTRAGMAPTPDGERLMPHARRMIEAERAAREAFALRPLQGHLRLGLVDDVGGLRMAEILARFGECHPEVTVALTVDQTSALGPMLDRGALDLAVLSPGCSVPWRDSDRLIHEEPLAWSVARGAGTWSRRPLPLALSTEGCVWRRMTLEALDGADIPYRVAVESDSSAALTAAVAAGLAVSPLPAARLGAGLRAVTVAEGAPPIGLSRLAIREGHAEDGSTHACVEALGARIVEAFGACCPPRKSSAA